MKKTINISIGGMSFQVEEDAYQRLEIYLAEVRAHFSVLVGADEILSDIEDRLAEQFEVKVGKGGILTKGTVEEMVKIMGEPSEFADNKQPADKGASPETKTPVGKRLMRDPEDAIIAGVCSGLAAYIGLDAVWVRLAFALSVFFGGFGVVLYIILWIIMPEAKTETEKMQMRGEPINLKAIEQTVKERMREVKSRFGNQNQTDFKASAVSSFSAKAEPANASVNKPAESSNIEDKKKDPGGVKTFLVAPLRALGKLGGSLGNVLYRIIGLIFKLIGLILTIAGALAIAALVVAAISLLFNINSPYVDFPLSGLAAGAVFYAGVIAAFFAAFVPVIFLVLIGTTLLANKSTFSKMGSIGLFAVWILAVAIAANIGFRMAPQIESAYKNQPGVQPVSRQLELKDFNKLKLESAYRAAVYPSAEFKVVISGRQKDLEALNARVENGELVVSKNYERRICFFCWHEPVSLEIYMPEISDINLSGASRVTVAGFESEEMKAVLSGASRAQLEIKTKNLTAELSGASNLEVTGTADSAAIKASGASEVLAKEAAIQTAAVDLSGASRARFSALNVLQGQASGASKIYYSSVLQKNLDLSGASREIQE